ncbi:MAG: hypothetical protein K0B11_13770 [Mariniphaga sp.]|nr:hypothetical protein [Mariniphaga sp.]
MKTFTFILLIFFLSGIVFSAQTDSIPDKNNEIEHRYGISVRYSVPAATGFAFDAFIQK